jgi:hypothetical protein
MDAGPTQNDRSRSENMHTDQVENDGADDITYESVNVNGEQVNSFHCAENDNGAENMAYEPIDMHTSQGNISSKCK